MTAVRRVASGRLGVLIRARGWAAILIGAALMAGVDEIVFHQIVGPARL